MSLLYRITCDGYTLFDQTVPGYDLTEAILTREINDGIFDSSLKIALFRTNPNADKVRLMTSTILVTEIDGETETVLFRGRPISIEPTIDYQVKITCEGDIKFLLDVPDIFSTDNQKSVTYKAGSENVYQNENMRTIPTGRATPCSSGGVNDVRQLTRFGENRTYLAPDLSSTGQTIYRSEVTEDDEDQAKVGQRVYLNIYADGNSRYASYALYPQDVEKVFTVEWAPSGVLTQEGVDQEFHRSLPSKKYQLSLHTAAYRTTIYSSGLGTLTEDIFRWPKNVTGIVRYLGNINLIGYGNSTLFDLDENGNVLGFNPEEQISVINESPIAAKDLDFCIAHFSVAPHWEVQTHTHGQSTVDWWHSDETIVYARTGVFNRLTSVKLKIYRTSGTTVRAMAGAILGRGGDEPGEANIPQDMIPPAIADGGASTGRYRYRYIGQSTRYKPNVIYSYDDVSQTWGIDSSGAETVPKTAHIPQDMTDTTERYLYIGTEEVYRNGEIFCFTGARWIRETFNYNSYVLPERQLFLGKTEIDAELEHTSTGTCYDSLKQWLNETGGYAKISLRNGQYFLDLLSDSGEKSNNFYLNYGENILDASENMFCDDIVTGVYVVGVMKDSGSNEEAASDDAEEPASGSAEETVSDDSYALLFRRLAVIDVEFPQEMTDNTRSYRYVGRNETYYSIHNGHTGIYGYEEWTDDTTGEFRRGWIEQPILDGESRPNLPQAYPQEMLDTSQQYEYPGPDVMSFKKGQIYTYDGGSSRWIVDTEAAEPILPDGFQADWELNVIWNTEAMQTYGRILSFLEVNVAGINKAQRLQHMADKGIEELRKKLSAFISLDVSAVDPRVVGLDGGTPVLGNYYPANIPWLGHYWDYKRLTKIETNMLDHTNTKLALGNKTPLLSDFVAKKGDRL